MLKRYFNLILILIILLSFCLALSAKADFQDTLNWASEKGGFLYDKLLELGKRGFDYIKGDLISKVIGFIKGFASGIVQEVQKRIPLAKERFKVETEALKKELPQVKQGIVDIFFKIKSWLGL